MTLTTHAIIGAAAASVFPEQPALAFVAGFASHFVIDAIPHWDYDGHLLSLKKDRTNALKTDMNMRSLAFLRDLSLIGADAIFGVLVSIALFCILLFHIPLEIIIVGACAGVLPDALQFVYWKTRAKTNLLEPLQRFHIWVQKGKTLKVEPWVGIGLQCFLIVLVLGVLKILI